jgi:hypothetical protein
VSTGTHDLAKAKISLRSRLGEADAARAKRKECVRLGVPIEEPDRQRKLDLGAYLDEYREHYLMIGGRELRESRRTSWRKEGSAATRFVENGESHSFRCQSDRVRSPLRGRQVMLENFPRTADEFECEFGSEEMCWSYLVRARWPEGVRCCKCHSDVVWRLNRNRILECRCGYQMSVTAGTIFHGTRKPLKLWFKAIFYMTALKTGVSAKALSRLLGLTYKVAWAWLHKLRAVISARPKEPLRGKVEVDEAYVGGQEEGLHGREHGDKSVVLVAAEDRGLPTGRVRLQVVPDASAASLTPAVTSNVETGATIRTDGWLGYARLTRNDYAHLVEKAGRKNAAKVFPHVHRVISLLKRVLLGTYQGAVGKVHLQAYLDEFAFRLNRRRCRFVTGIARSLLTLAVAANPRPYKTLVGLAGLSGAA